MNYQQFLNEKKVFTTREFAFLCKRSIDSSSRTLGRLCKEGVIQKITRGLWAKTGAKAFTALGTVPYILNNEQGYVSFLTALHRHEVISQIPGKVQVASTGHSRELITSFAQFELIHIQPGMMLTGIDPLEIEMPYRMASAEEALLDTFYIATRKGKRFSKLPELDLSEFSEASFLKLLDEQIKMAQIKDNIRNRWEKSRNS